MALGLRWQDCSPEKLLVERFQITTGFHPQQRNIIEQLVQGKRILAIQRTGWGKSLCYQMASLYYPNLTIVFSPLKALMRDQCQRCNDVYALPSAIISSDFSEEQNIATLERAIAGDFKILFIAPERLDNSDWQTHAIHMRIDMVVIDEAHCISTWGHDFRPHYQRIVHLLDAIPESTPVLALTATANEYVERDILQQMGTDVQVIRGTMLRPNLYLDVVPLCGDEEKLSYVGEMIPHFPGVGIIYTATQRDAEKVAIFLQRQGFVAEYYHAGREDGLRQDIEQKLMSNQYKVVCSTNALGMGIDKRDIRFLIHYHIPGSPIHYYQEMGRAGRDGNVARCILLYDPEDLTIQKHFTQQAKAESKSYKTVLLLLKRNPQGLRERELMHITGLSQKALRSILADLRDQNFIERGKRSVYTATSRLGQIDFSSYDIVRAQKLRELDDIQNYAQGTRCYMEYLTRYLGDPAGQNCGVCKHCQPANFPPIRPSKEMQETVKRFLEDEWLPVIERHNGMHEAGWSLSRHGTTRVGNLVRMSKYEEAGPFAWELVERAANVIRMRYPTETINGIVSVPPTKSGPLVENFARDVADVLGIEYLPTLAKIRDTQEQKSLGNWVQKTNNVKDAFVVLLPELVAGRVLLLIDDICDSGYMLREVGKTLMQAGAQAVHPFTITHTVHSDDQ